MSNQFSRSVPYPHVLSLYHSPRTAGTETFLKVVSWFNNGTPIRNIVFKLRRPVSHRDYIGFNISRVDAYCMLVYAAKLGFIAPNLLPSHGVRPVRTVHASAKIVNAELTLEEFYNALSMYRSGFSPVQVGKFAEAWNDPDNDVPGMRFKACNIADCVSLMMTVRNERTLYKRAQVEELNRTPEGRLKLSQQTYTFDELLEYNGYVKPRRYLALYPLTQAEYTEEMRYDTELLNAQLAAKPMSKVLEARVQCTHRVAWITEQAEQGLFKLNGTDYASYVKPREQMSSLPYQMEQCRSLLDKMQELQSEGFRRVLENNHTARKNKKRASKSGNSGGKATDDLSVAHSNLIGSAPKPIRIKPTNRFAKAVADTEIAIELEDATVMNPLPEDPPDKPLRSTIRKKPKPVTREPVPATPAPATPAPATPAPATPARDPNDLPSVMDILSDFD